MTGQCQPLSVEGFFETLSRVGPRRFRPGPADNGMPVIGLGAALLRPRPATGRWIPRRGLSALLQAGYGAGFRATPRQAEALKDSGRVLDRFGPGLKAAQENAKLLRSGGFPALSEYGLKTLMRFAIADTLASAKTAAQRRGASRAELEALLRDRRLEFLMAAGLAGVDLLRSPTLVDAALQGNRQAMWFEVVSRGLRLWQGRRPRRPPPRRPAPPSLRRPLFLLQFVRGRNREQLPAFDRQQLAGHVVRAFDQVDRDLGHVLGRSGPLQRGARFDARLGVVEGLAQAAA